MTSKNINYIVAYNDHGKPLQLIVITHSEQIAKYFVQKLEEADEELEWKVGEVNDSVLFYSLGDAQYIIIPLTVYLGNSALQSVENLYTLGFTCDE